MLINNCVIYLCVLARVVVVLGCARPLFPTLTTTLEPRGTTTLAAVEPSARGGGDVIVTAASSRLSGAMPAITGTPTPPVPATTLPSQPAALDDGCADDDDDDSTGVSVSVDDMGTYPEVVRLLSCVLYVYVVSGGTTEPVGGVVGADLELQI